PVLEAQHALLTYAAGDADGEDHEAGDRDDLETRQPHLELAVDADGEVVDDGEDDPEDGDDDADVEVLVPVLDNEACGDQGERVCDGPWFVLSVIPHYYL